MAPENLFSLLFKQMSVSKSSTTTSAYLYNYKFQEFSKPYLLASIDLLSVSEKKKMLHTLISAPR